MRALHARGDKICVELLTNPFASCKTTAGCFLSNIIADSYRFYVIFKNHVQKTYNGGCALDEKLIIVKFYSQNKGFKVYFYRLENKWKVLQSPIHVSNLSVLDGLLSFAE